MHVVYILKNERDNDLYIGMTKNLSRRLKEHQSGKTQSLKNKGELTLLEFHQCKDIQEACRLEKELKKGYKREEIRKKYRLWRSARAVNRTGC